MGFEYQKRPERRREDEPILPPRGQTRRMSAKAAARLIHAAKKSGAEVRHEGGSALEKPTTGKQLKSCPLCDRTDGPSAAYACPMCGQRASSGLEKPVDSVQMKGAGTADAAERQADALGAKIGTELAGMSVGAGTLSPSAASVAERHVGTSLAGTELRNDASANAYASSMGALAVTEGDRVSFAAGRLDGSTSAGRSVVGHELVHVAQQRAHGMSARQGFLGLGGDEGGEGGGSSGGGVMTGMGLAGPSGGGEGSLRSGPAATEAPGGGETAFGGTIGLPDGAEEYGVHGHGTVEVRVNENGTVTINVSGGAGVRVGGVDYGVGGSGVVTVGHSVETPTLYACDDGSLVPVGAICSSGGAPAPAPGEKPRVPAPPRDVVERRGQLDPWPKEVNQGNSWRCWAAASSSFLQAVSRTPTGIATNSTDDIVLGALGQSCLVSSGQGRLNGLPGPNRQPVFSWLGFDGGVGFSGLFGAALVIERTINRDGQPALLDLNHSQNASLGMTARHAVVVFGFYYRTLPDRRIDKLLLDWMDPEDGSFRLQMDAEFILKDAALFRSAPLGPSPSCMNFCNCFDKCPQDGGTCVQLASLPCSKSKHCAD